MYRHLLIFPDSADVEAVERIVEDELAPHFRSSEGFRSLSTSVGPLMGPAARNGGARLVVEAVFESLESSLAAISASGFETTATTVEALGAEIFLFEFREL
jgi:hypothetical protein